MIITMKKRMRTSANTQRWGALAACALGIAGMAMTQQAHASGTFTFTKIADTSTTDPSGGTFGMFDDPSISGSNVAFVGFDSTYTRIGVYLSKNGTLSKIADLKTTDPSGGKFTNFGTVSISGSTVGFQGTYNNGSYAYTNQGFYTGTGGALTTLVDIKTLVPHSTKKFTNFQGNLVGSLFAFLGTSAVGVNIYGLQNGTMSTLVDTSTADPSGGKFTEMSDVTSDLNNNVLFSGYCSTTKISGLYEKSGSTISKLVDSTTADPSGGTFMGFGPPVFAGSNVAFNGVNTNVVAKGIYEVVGSQIVTIADTNTADPVGGKFGYFSDPAASSEGIAFIGSDASEANPGVYAYIGGSLHTVITAGATLGGKTISDLELSQTGMDGYNIAIHIYFTDSTEAIYMAQYVP